MTNIANIKTVEKENGGGRKVTIEFLYSDTNPKWSDDDLEIEVLKMLQLDEDTIKHWLCNHEWEFVSGQELQSNW